MIDLKTAAKRLRITRGRMVETEALRTETEVARKEIVLTMGCVLCNITSCEEFVQGANPPVKNPFYSKTEEEKDRFLEELAYDIASRHPELVRKINEHARKLDEAAVPGNSRVKDVFWYTPGGKRMNNSTKKREKEIVKAIKQVGWLGVSSRIKTKEDMEIYHKLQKDFMSRVFAEDDEKLKKAGISF